MTIPYYLLSQFFVESLSNSNTIACSSNNDTDRLAEDCEKKLLAVEGIIAVQHQQQQQNTVVLLLPPPPAVAQMESNAI